MRSIELSTKGFGKAAKRQVLAIMQQPMKVSKVSEFHTVNYILRNQEGKMIARVEEGKMNKKATLFIND